jgi:hypothetical protein
MSYDENRISDLIEGGLIEQQNLVNNTKSIFCQWCYNMQIIANRDCVVVAAQYYDALEYFFKIGFSPKDAYPKYLEVVKRCEAISEYEEKQREADDIVNEMNDW